MGSRCGLAHVLLNAIAMIGNVCGARELSLVVVAVASMAAGCISPSTVMCGGGLACPANTRCDVAHNRCITPAADAACAGLGEGDSCILAGAPGSCHVGACEPATFEWKESAAVAHPWARGGHATATLGDKIVLFGGADGYEPYVADTWEWNGRVWSELAPAASPPARANHAMATLGKHVILFGGDAAPAYPLETTSPSFGDTWQWDGTTWTALAPATSPPARTKHAMATLGDKVVLFGGTKTAVSLVLPPPASLPVPVSEGDTWVWDGTTWTALAPSTSPPARMNHAMATLGNKVILFGGEGASGLTDDTWEWDGTTWAQLSPPTRPTARRNHAMATLGNKVILFGGEDASGPIGDSWEWDGKTWTQLAAEGPSPRSESSMASRNGEVLLFGGYGFGPNSIPAKPGSRMDVGPGPGSVAYFAVSDTSWEWNGESWLPRAVLPPTGFPLPDNKIAPLGGKAVLFNSGSGTWEWDGIAWSALALTRPTALDSRGGFAMASLGATIVLFGGTGIDSDYLTPLADRWEWDGASWKAGASTTSPPARVGHAMATLGNKVVLFGGTSGAVFAQLLRPLSPEEVIAIGSQPSFADTWEWDGATWTPRTPARSPSARWGHAMVTVGNKIVLFGGQGADGLLDDTWEWDGATWTQLDPPTSPPARSGHALATVNTSVVLFGGSGAGGSFQHDTWVLTGNTWAQLSPLTYPAARANHVMATVAGKAVLFGGTSTPDTWLLDVPLP